MCWKNRPTILNSSKNEKVWAIQKTYCTENTPRARDLGSEIVAKVGIWFVFIIDYESSNDLKVFSRFSLVFDRLLVLRVKDRLLSMSDPNFSSLWGVDRVFSNLKKHKTTHYYVQRFI